MENLKKISIIAKMKLHSMLSSQEDYVLIETKDSIERILNAREHKRIRSTKNGRNK